MDLLPIGSVVLAEKINTRCMIFGRCQQNNDTGEKYDYVACPYPEGITDSRRVVLFNHSDIKLVFSIGYQNSDELRLRAELLKVRGDNDG